MLDTLGLRRLGVDGAALCVVVFWSPQWWKSDEAIARLETLWCAWDHLCLDTTTGPSVWWRDHVKATVLEPLPHKEPPATLLPDVRASAA